jgi:hypothetical protein
MLIKVPARTSSFSFGKFVFRLVATLTLLNILTVVGLVATYFVIAKGGPAHQAVDYLNARYADVCGTVTH